MFNAWAMRKYDRERVVELESILGTKWDSATIHRMVQTAESTTTPNAAAEDAARWHAGVRIPLSLLLATHDFVKELAKKAPLPGAAAATMPIALGDYFHDPNEGGELVSMSNASKEAFFDLMSRSGAYPGARPRVKNPSQIDGGHLTPEDDAASVPLHSGPKGEFKAGMRAAFGKAYGDEDGGKDSKRRR